MSITAAARVARHMCHWPGCPIEVPAAMWGCKAHWFSLPRHLRERIWTTYRRGQEVRKDPTVEYVAAAREVQRWIEEYRGTCRGMSRGVRT